MRAACTQLDTQLASLSGTRPSAALINDVPVPAWGGEHPLKAVAQVEVQQPRTLVATPHDPSLVQGIRKALARRSPDAQVAEDGARVRMTLPAPSAETRAARVREAKACAEQARVAVRVARKDAVNALRRAAKGPDGMREATLRGRERDLQTRSDEAIESIDAALVRAVARIEET
jgi:ribosome recycling factor